MTYEFDPELAAALPFLPMVGGSADGDDLAGARSKQLEFAQEMNANVATGGLSIEDLVVPSPDTPVPVRIYRPADTQQRPGVLHLHGGAFTFGSIEMEHGTSVRVASEVGAVVVSVDYRLAPEHPFPAGLEDCYTALSWMHDNAHCLGVDRDRIAVFGMSAGGGLAAGLALLARDRGGPSLCFQYLGMPELDDRLETASMRRFTDTPVWYRDAAVLSWSRYLQGCDGPVSSYAAPARATQLSRLPKAFISTMEFDPLRDEGILYALRLLEAGVSVELHQYAATFHGSNLVAGADVTRRQSVEQTEVLRRALAAVAVAASSR
jgi:acetyl esterase/lipase